jgi:hypothetical protein
MATQVQSLGDISGPSVASAETPDASAVGLVAYARIWPRRAA